MKLLRCKFKNIQLNLNHTDWSFILALITLFSLSIFFRFFNIKNIGIRDPDEFQYLQVAKWWLEGNYDLDRYFRPVIYILNSFAVGVFGYHDYAVNLFNSVADVINIILIFYVTYLLTKQFWLGLSSSLVYSFFPGIVEYARNSMSHIPSSTFVLLSLIFFIKFIRNIRKESRGKHLFLVLSSLSITFAANIHPDLALLAPLYLTFAFIILLSNKKEKILLRLLKWIKYFFVYSIVFFLPYVIGGVYYGFSTVIDILIWERSHNYQDISHYKLFLRILFDSLVRFSNQFILFLFIGALFIISYMLGKKKNLKILFLVPPFLVLGYTILGSLVLRGYWSRLMIPIVPLVVITIIVGYFEALNLFFRKIDRSIFIIYVISLIIAFYNIYFQSRNSIKKIIVHKSIYREIYDVMKDKIDQHNKILITPYIIVSAPKGFQAPFYFGENAPYIIDSSYKSETLEDFVVRENIKYIFISKKELDERIVKGFKSVDTGDIYFRSVSILFRGTPEFKPKINNYRFKITNYGYSLNKELQILNEYLSQNRAEKIYSSQSGDIYKL